MAAPASAPAHSSTPSTLTYESILAASVQQLDTSSKENPLPAQPETKLADLISPDGAVLFLVRRPGCALCRGDGRKLADVFEKFFPSSESDVTTGMLPAASTVHARPRLLALTKENLDDELRQFLPVIEPAGQLLLHKDRALYKQLQLHKLGWLDMFSPTMLKKYFDDKKILSGNLKGEGWIPGAIVVVGSAEQGILFTHLEDFGKQIDFTPIKAALAQIKGAKPQQE